MTPMHRSRSGRPTACSRTWPAARFEGWPAIRAFFANGLTRTANLSLVPDEFWANDDGLAVRYVMSGDVVQPETFGPEYVGRRWAVPCHVVPPVRR